MRALRKGWIQTTEQRKVTREEPPAYLLWADDGVASDKIANGQQPIHLLVRNGHDRITLAFDPCICTKWCPAATLQGATVVRTHMRRRGFL